MSGPARGRAAIIGGGVIGGGWAARFALMGWDVAVHDPHPEAERRVDEVLAAARRAMPGLFDAPLPPEGRVRHAASLAEAVEGADWVQESVPERLEVKHRVLAEILAHAPAGAIVASSTSGFRPSELQEGAADPGRILVAHPFNPVYLLPLVELVASPANPPGVVDRAAAILEGLGMYPLKVRREIEAHVADRLLEAVWREALWLVRDGIATTEEIDNAIRYGFGLRWAQMGLFETYRIAGGEAGMRHFLAQFGPALKWPWTRLMDVPELDDALVELIASQSDAQSGRHAIRELEAMRDANLVGIMRALKWTRGGVGPLLAEADRRLRGPDAPPDPDRPVLTRRAAVPLDWTDYNGHMTEARYLDAFGMANDRFMELIGCTPDYIAHKGSFFTAETHIRHLAEMNVGERYRIETQLLGISQRKMHLFHSLIREDDGTLAATGEHVLIHVSLATRRPAPFAEPVGGALARLWEGHARLPRPEGAGRYVGQPR